MGLSVAYIGMGVMGQRMLDNLSTHMGYQLQAAWDPDQCVCTKIAEK